MGVVGEVLLGVGSVSENDSSSSSDSGYSGSDRNRTDYDFVSGKEGTVRRKMKQSDIGSDVGIGGSQWGCSKHGTRLKISRFHGAHLTLSSPPHEFNIFHCLFVWFFLFRFLFCFEFLVIKMPWF